MAELDDSKMYDQPESMTKEEYRKQQDLENARERKQIADVTRAERAYRRENNIPLSAKTNPGYYHMQGGPSAGGGSGSAPSGGGGARIPNAGELIHNMNPLKLADGGIVHHQNMAGNHSSGTRGPGVRSHQDYKK